MTASQLAVILYGILTLSILALGGFAAGNVTVIWIAAAAAGLTYVFQGVQEFGEQNGVEIRPLIAGLLFFAPIIVTVLGFLVLATET